MDQTNFASDENKRIHTLLDSVCHYFVSTRNLVHIEEQLRCSSGDKLSERNSRRQRHPSIKYLSACMRNLQNAWEAAALPLPHLLSLGSNFYRHAQVEFLILRLQQPNDQRRPPTTAQLPLQIPIKWHRRRAQRPLTASTPSWR